MKYYCEDSQQVLQELNSQKSGLTEKEAAERLLQNGANELKAAKGKSLLRRFAEQVADPMIVILLAAAAISGVLAVLENDSFADVIIILAVVLINAVLGVYQESKAEKAIEALQDMAAATSKVVRDGKMSSILSKDLVVGDIICLEAGDAVPADARILESASLKAEEAALTGESVPVTKLIDQIFLADGERDVPLGDRKNMVYMGSTIVYGRAVAVVTATGMDTEMGKIADALSQAQEGQTPLQRKLTQLSKVLTKLVIGICVLVFAIQMIRAGSLNFEVALNSFMIAVSLAVAAIPEGLAAVVTVVLSIGVTNMSKRNAIIRRLTAVETLGCAQVICSDKTGTLTQNQMTVVDSFGAEEKELSAAMALCSDAELDADGSVTGEPTEAALVVWANRIGQDKNLLKQSMPRVMEAPFDSGRKMMSTVHKRKDDYIQFTKGAPDVVLTRCAFYLEDGQLLPMTEEYRKKVLQANKSMADRALRVLACGQRVWTKKPESEDADLLEQELCFLGLCGMIDPVRPEVKAAIDECREAGIRPVMITGDHVDTAAAIAKELGILQDGSLAVTGAELEKMDDAEFAEKFRNISVYARVQPEHKTRIVNAWRNAGYVTAMTGDGVNDAPSIKAADIGIGMGITGTDVTKNVADMVLADDNFATIVKAIENGRNLYRNIQRAIQFLLSGNTAGILAVLYASFMALPVPFKAVHLLFINLLTDSLPAIALGVEPHSSDVMNEKPRPKNQSILTKKVLTNICVEGVVIGVMTMIAFYVGFMRNAEVASTMAFSTLCLSRLVHGFNCKSDKPVWFTKKMWNNKSMIGAFFVGFVLLNAVLLVPALQGIFAVAPLTIAELLTVYGLSLGTFVVVQILKMIRK
mgnify:CR=1 FL=1